MTDINYNVSYILIPFSYSGKDRFDKYVNRFKQQWKLREAPFTNDIFLGFIETLFNSVVVLDNEKEHQSIDDISIYYFNTGMGFIVFKKTYLNTSVALAEWDDTQSKNTPDSKEQKNVIEQQSKELEILISSIEEGSNDDLRDLKQNLGDKINLFYNSSVKRCLVFSMAVGKITNDQSLFWNDDIKKTQIIGNGNLHYCYGSPQKMSIVTDQYLSNLALGKEKEANIQAEERFRSKYEDDFFMMFMLLHHERNMYFYLREQMVSKLQTKSIKVGKVKDKIINLLTCYSYKIVTEDVDFQNIYEQYRDTLSLTEYENALSELVFRLNEEADKNKERRLTIIEIFIALIGLDASFPHIRRFIEILISLFN